MAKSEQSHGPDPIRTALMLPGLIIMILVIIYGGYQLQKRLNNSDMIKSESSSMQVKAPTLV